MSADYHRIHRLLEILVLTQNQPGWNSKRLAAHFGVSERSVFRDLDVLTAVGVPFDFDQAQQGYQVRKDFFLPPVDLTFDESLAVVLLAEKVARREQMPFLEPAYRAIAKVRSRLAPPVQEMLREMDRRMEVRLAAAAGDDAARDAFDKVRQAIQSRHVLECRYESLESRRDGQRGQEVFAFHPYCLFYNQRAWYVAGHHGGRGEVRNLKLNRFAALKTTQQTYAIPEDFSLASHLGLAWRMIRGSRRHRVVLRFDEQFAETVADTQWHPTQEVQWQEDGSILFRCQVDGLSEIVWWVLGMGPHCRVLEPAELRDQVRDLAERTLQQYGQGGANPDPGEDAAATGKRIAGVPAPAPAGKPPLRRRARVRSPEDAADKPSSGSKGGR